MKKDRLIQTVLVLIFAVCTVFSGFVSVLACIPSSDDIEVVEQMKASVSRASAYEEVYRIDVSGALKNNTDELLTVDRLEFVLGSKDLDGTVTVAVENVTIAPRNIVTVAKSNVANGDYNVIKSVTATVGGDSMELRNSPKNSPTAALIPLAITVVFAFLLVRACKVRYYMMQEDRADKQSQDCVAE